jgi:hypothetical protein
MNITAKKVKDGWRATATKAGNYLCSVWGYSTRSRAERACAAQAREEMRRQQQQLGSSTVQMAQAALV